MSAAAAASASRGEQKKLKAQRMTLLKQRAERRKIANRVFDKLAGVDGILVESKIKDFMSEVMGIGADDLDHHAVQLVIDTLQSAKKEGGYEKEAVLAAQQKYGEYIKHCKTIEKMYKKFDTDGDGGLSKNEFRLALDSYERNLNRSPDNGLTRVHLFVTNADIDFILEQADADKDGQISKNEMLPALAAWEELATIKMEKSQECCTIL